MCASASSRARQRSAVRVYVALGANLGDAAATLRDAIRWLADLPGTTVYAASSLYRTAPWEASGPDFINAVAALDTQLTAPDLLVCLHTLEARAGRERPYLNAPRTLDLDLLLYGSAGIDSPRLTVPHPRMWQRAFVLVPLAEVAPEWVTPEALQAVAGQQIERMV
jgi:2-amino-4-hydroxy-6-hydroxymethyldihydropteridine diphosphokinase